MKLKVLVVTRRLEELAGSEVVAHEVAEWFAAQGDDVTLAAPIVGPPMTNLARDFTLVSDLSEVDLSAFDLVWSQHQAVLLIPYGIESSVKKLRLPYIVAATLSPYEVAEHVDGALARALGARVWANSAETADHAAAINRGVPRRRAIHVLGNAAPAAFWAPGSLPAPAIGRLLVVSNHVPVEVREATALLRAADVDVRIVGSRDTVTKVDADMLEWADAVVTIGKTVVYGIARQRPVYVYDHFGGDGWLTAESMSQSQHFNFSGRAFRRRLTPAELVSEVLEGYADARSQAVVLATRAEGLRLDHHLARLRRTAARSHPRLRALRAGMAFASRGSRAHLATVRRYVAATTAR